MIFKLLVEQILTLNRITIEQNGGQFIPPNNTLYPEKIDYLIEAVDGEMFGEKLYPAIHDKAALYLHNIVSNHFFRTETSVRALPQPLCFSI